jgi:DNA-binding NarL/FixJ family response regulator
VPLLVKGVKVELEGTENETPLKDSEKLVFPPVDKVLDLSMPVTNGLEAVRELKRMSPSLPVVMLTDFNLPQLTNQALSAGVRAVVSKSEAAGPVDEIQALLEPAA